MYGLNVVHDELRLRKASINSCGADGHVEHYAPITNLGKHANVQPAVAVGSTFCLCN